MRTRLSSQVGPAIRKLRLSKRMTLGQLSLRSGIPLSTLSKLELAQVALTYDKLLRLCRALEVDLEKTVWAEAENMPIASGRRSILRAGEGERLVLGPHVSRPIAIELLSKSMTPTFLDVVAADLEAHGPLRQLGGEAFLLVLSGAAVLHTEVYAPLDLAEGDAVYFDGRLDHAILAGGGAGARVLLVVAAEAGLPVDGLF